MEGGLIIRAVRPIHALKILKELLSVLIRHRIEVPDDPLPCLRQIECFLTLAGLLQLCRQPSLHVQALPSYLAGHRIIATL